MNAVGFDTLKYTRILRDKAHSIRAAWGLGTVLLALTAAIFVKLLIP